MPKSAQTSRSYIVKRDGCNKLTKLQFQSVFNMENFEINECIISFVCNSLVNIYSI